MHSVRDFEHLRRGLPGLSPRLLGDHLNLYAAYVGKLNEIEQRLAAAGRTAASPIYNDYSELRRREVSALNGVCLHELYFEALGPSPALGLPSPSDASPLREPLDKAFGGLDAWRRDLRASATSTDGWVLLTLSQADGLLHHYVLDSADAGLPARQAVLLALDCSDHAYAADYGLAKQDYLTAALALIDWSKVEARFMSVLAANSPAPLHEKN